MNQPEPEQKPKAPIEGSISKPFILRPIATTLLTLGLLLVGILAFRELPVAALPQVEYPTIVVSTYLPGASAETMASSVTTPLERQFGQVPSLEQMTSISSLGSSQITLQFALDRDIDSAEQDVQAAINAASALLPRTLPAPPTYSKSNPADAPILTLAVDSKTLELRDVDNYADSILAQKISQVSGVGLVTLAGAEKPAVRVQVDPERLAGSGLTMEDVRLALVAANVNQPKGNIDGPRRDFTISTNDQLQDAKAFAPIVIAYKEGSPIRLSDVAKPVDGVENAELAAWSDGQRAVLVNVQRQPGANVIQVADRVKALLPQLEASMPRGIQVHVVSDRTETVRASVRDVEITLAITIALVVVVIYGFLRDLRATMVPAVAVPLSLVATFGVMYLVGFSLNNLSLMALTIATGFVVDDAIVMIENIARFVEQGETPLRAALIGAKQIGFTIVSLTVSLVAVLIPLLFMGGIVGRLFREFAVTLAVAIGISALLSLTLTPMMTARLLRPERELKRGRFYDMSERFYETLVGWYDSGLVWVLRHRRTTLLVTIATVAFTLLLFWIIPKGFFPRQDTGLIVGITEASSDASFAKMMALQTELADIARKDKDVANVAAFVGSDGTNPTSTTGRLSIVLKPHGDRDDSSDVISDRLASEFAKVPGITTSLSSVQDLQIESRVSGSAFDYTLEDADAAELATWSQKMRHELEQAPELTSVTTDAKPPGRGLSVVIDRDTAGRLGVSAQTIDDTLYDAFGQRQVSIIFTQLNTYRVILEVPPALKQDPEILKQIYLRTQSGGLVQLSAFARVDQTSSPVVIAHEGQFPSVTLSFDTAKGSSLGAAIAAVHAAEQHIGLPPSVHAGFRGTAAAFTTSLATEPFLILAALITVYIVLGVLYESFIHPITILSTLPSAGVGAALALLVTGHEFDVIALIGIVLLIGIVKKNAIMMIDFALEAEREQGKSPEDAIHQACLLRFRPIMMTTMAALLGAIPLAFGTGTGSELRRPMGIAIVGGLMVSQILTLYTTPVIYLYMDGLRLRFARRRSHDAAAELA
ncbi:MAG TPA: multidrug efflux RND transporter permease subunit [Polyangiaceae bacterium]|jgi:multidrug efflux pump